MSKFLGIDLASVSATAEHELGLRVQNAEGNKTYVYVKSDATGVAVNKTVSIADGFVVTSGAANAAVFGVAQVALGASEYGFVQVQGVVTAAIADTTAAGTLLSLLSAASGKFTAVVAVAEGGATTHILGAQSVRAQSMTVEAADIASVLLF